ncbi:hypothetical protein KUF71_014998 [Frankliniella fusca]|uniref:Histone deacetylase domain-containing protein n=1 Tax=Frankliniella fusca TaxID=407009 RepID=A0AAE1LQH0_9NEOP|nr:hypothetical protein KUF71_014998 [Frankliniella fusca]
MKHTVQLTETQEQQLKRLHGLPIIHHKGYVCPLPPEHRFPMQKFHRVLHFLENDGIIDSKKQVVEPQQISTINAQSVHTAEYVDKFFNGKTTGEEQRVTGFEWTPGLASRVRYETGGTLLAAEIALERGIACSTAGGTHHAFPDHGAGFCLINDLAVTAQKLLDSKKISRVLIVDLDVHQGDGTAYIFQNNDSVYTFSMHCQQNFPFRKQQSDLDVNLSKGDGDHEFMRLLQASLHEHLPFVLKSFQPDLVLYDAGVDPHEADSLGYLRMTDLGLMKRDCYVLEQILRCGIPCATVIGGGYDKILDELARRHTIIHRAATKVFKARRL